MSVTILPPSNLGAANGILQQQQQAVNNLTYTPIDTRVLALDATRNAAENARRSLALERQLSPGVAAARSGLQTQVADELAQQGNLPADVANQVSRASAGAAGSSGLLGSQGPLTAASLGLTALNLADTRRANAGALLSQNQLPTAGLDPGALASATIANANAANNFALGRLGAQGNIANSQIGALQAQNEAGVGVPSSTGVLPYVSLGQPQGSSFSLNGTPISPGQLTTGQQAAAQRQQINNPANTGY